MINRTHTAFYFLCLSSFIYGMEPYPQDIPTAHSLALIKDHIMVGHSRGCCAINFDTKEISTQLHDKATYQITANLNKTQLALLTDTAHREKAITVYDVTDIKKPIKIWVHGLAMHSPCSIAFSTTDDTIFLYQRGTIVSNKENRYELGEYNNRTFITYHPTKNEFIYQSRGLTLAALKLHAHGSDYTITEYPPLNLKDSIDEVSYNPQGTASVLLNYQTKEVHLYDLENNKRLSSYYGYNDISWHPNGFILALLSGTEITYLNTRTFIRLKQPNMQPFLKPYMMTRHALDISPDGKKIAAIRIRRRIETNEGIYEIYDIPFETIINDIYHLGTREKLFTIFHLIKNYNMLLPNEVLSPLMKSLLQLHEYSTNRCEQFA